MGAIEARQGRVSGSRSRSGTRREDLRLIFELAGARSLTRDKENRGGPGRKQIQTRNQFGHKRGKEGPVPPQKPGKNGSDSDIQCCISRGESTLCEQREGQNLESVGSNRHQPGHALLARLHGLDGIESPHTNVPQKGYNGSGVAPTIFYLPAFCAILNSEKERG